jgi:hypothetical protein
MNRIMVFSSLFGVSEWEELPDPASFSKHTYAYGTESAQWYVTSIANRHGKTTGGPLWIPINSSGLSPKMQATALIMGIPV